jgi:hypothetical protein
MLMSDILSCHSTAPLQLSYSRVLTTLGSRDSTAPTNPKTVHHPVPETRDELYQMVAFHTLSQNVEVLVEFLHFLDS